MSLQLPNLRVDLKKLSKLPVLNHFSDQLTGYESRLKGIVKDLDLRSKGAREKSRRKLDKFAGQIRKTRSEVEKQVIKIVNREGKKLNNGLTHILEYLRSVAVTEDRVPARKAKKSSKTRKPRANRSTLQ